MAVSSQPKMTYEEWLDFPTEEGVRTELIDGEVSVAPEPTARHQRIVRRLLYAFETHIRAHGGGEVLPPVNVRLADDLGLAPDVVFIREWGDDPLTYHGPPPFVVEVVSDERRDLTIKRDRYERHGVDEYWAVLPATDKVHVFRLRDGKYRASVHEPPEILSPLALPGLAIDLTELLA